MIQTSFLDLKNNLFFYKIGEMSVSVYIFDDSSKAFCSLRMKVVEIRPLPVLDKSNNVTSTMARRTKEADCSVDREFKKLRYAIHKYVFENIKNERVVVQRNPNIGTFALDLFDMHEELRNIKFTILIITN